MNQRRLLGVCLVKNEDDIIAQALTFAAQYCDRIFVLDNGSTDETWPIVHRLAQANGAIVPFEQTFKPYGDYLRGMVYEALHSDFSDDDWWLIVDADEFLAEDPRPVIETAVRQGTDLINTWHVQFFFTEKDLEACEHGGDHRDIPIFDRRRYYHINTQEPRLFRNQTQPYRKVRVKDFVPDSLRRTCRRRIFVRHYQYRDPEQIEKRLRLRYGHVLFPHVQSSDWRSVVRDSRGLCYHRDGEPWRFTTSGLWYFYRHRAQAKYDGAARRLRRLLSRK